MAGEHLVIRVELGPAGGGNVARLISDLESWLKRYGDLGVVSWRVEPVVAQDEEHS